MCFGGWESFYNYGIMLTFIMRGMFSVLHTFIINNDEYQSI